MRAAVLYGIRDLRIEDLPSPVAGEGEVLLRVQSVGVCGSDVHYLKDGRIGTQVLEKPLIIGHEFSARVAGIGSGVSGLQIGQLVAVDPGVSCGKCEPCQMGHPNLCPDIRFCGTAPHDHGVMAEYVVMPADNCYSLPDGFIPEMGALLEPLGVAIHSVNLGHINPGQTAAVFGAGPIGLLVAAVARASGASQIFMSEPLAYRRKFAESFLNCPVLDPANENVVDKILSLTGKRGVDVAFEAAGAAETPRQATEVVRPGGVVVLAGIPAGDDLVLSASTTRRKGLTIKLVRRMKHTYPLAIRLVSSGQVDLHPLVTHRFALGDAAKALELVSGYGDGVIKAVVEI